MGVIEMSEKDLRAVRRRQAIRVFLLTVVLVPVVLLVVANTQDVDFDWLFDEQAIPVAAVIGGAWAAGLVCGLLLAWRAGWKAVMAGAAPRDDRADTTTVVQPGADERTDDGDPFADERAAESSAATDEDEEVHTAKS